MFESFKIKRNVFLSIVLFLLFSFIFTFVFSHRSFLNFEKKHRLIKLKKEYITALMIEINQLNENINRLKTDREYVVSYAKTFGYIDKTKNEQIVRIIEPSKNIDTFVETSGSAKKDDASVAINITVALVLASLVMLVISSYIVIISFRKRNISNVDNMSNS